MEIQQLKKPANLDLTGGESVYCINQVQMKKARQRLESSDLSPELKALWEACHRLSRNDQASLAFCLIEELNGKS